MKKLMIPRVDFEAAIPFQVLAFVLWPSGVVRGWKGVLFFGGAVVLLAQFMILTRTFNQGRGERLRYLLVNELYYLVTIGFIIVIQSGVLRSRL